MLKNLKKFNFIFYLKLILIFAFCDELSFIFYSRFLMSSLSSKSQLRFAKLSENAFPPLKGSAYAAGWDLRR